MSQQVAVLVIWCLYLPFIFPNRHLYIYFPREDCSSFSPINKVNNLLCTFTIRLKKNWLQPSCLNHMKRKELCVSEKCFDITDSNETAKFNTSFPALNGYFKRFFYSVHHDVHSFISFQFVNREFDKRKRKLFMEVTD